MKLNTSFHITFFVIIFTLLIGIITLPGLLKLAVLPYLVLAFFITKKPPVYSILEIGKTKDRFLGVKTLSVFGITYHLYLKHFFAGEPKWSRKRDHKFMTDYNPYYNRFKDYIKDKNKGNYGKIVATTKDIKEEVSQQVQTLVKDELLLKLPNTEIGSPEEEKLLKKLQLWD
jgi:hypothetical protein